MTRAAGGGYIPGASWRHPWGPGSDNTRRQDHPVTHVAYEDAEVCAEWARVALPSQAEWEYAARRARGAISPGERAAAGRELIANFWQGNFPWRNTGAKGWRGTSPVGVFPANGYGLYDMTGNVWEWTTDYCSHRGAGSEETNGACCTPPLNPRVTSAEGSYDFGRPGAHIPAG